MEEMASSCFVCEGDETEREVEITVADCVIVVCVCGECLECYMEGLI